MSNDIIQIGNSFSVWFNLLNVKFNILGYQISIMNIIYFGIAVFILGLFYSLLFALNKKYW